MPSAAATYTVSSLTKSSLTFAVGTRRGVVVVAVVRGGAATVVSAAPFNRQALVEIERKAAALAAPLFAAHLSNIAKRAAANRGAAPAVRVVAANRHEAAVKAWVTRRLAA